MFITQYLVYVICGDTLHKCCLKYVLRLKVFRSILLGVSYIVVVVVNVLLIFSQAKHKNQFYGFFIFMPYLVVKYKL